MSQYSDLICFTVLPSHFGPGGTRFDIYVRDDGANLINQFDYCEVTVRSLPITAFSQP